MRGREGEAAVVAQRPLEPEQQRDGGQRRERDLRRAARSFRFSQVE